MDLRTKCEKNRVAKDMKVYQRYTELISEPNASTAKVYEILMQEFEIYSTSTLWAIRKRVEAKLRKGGKK